MWFNCLKTKNLTNKQCEFSYRNSIFKSKKYVIISALINLKKEISNILTFELKNPNVTGLISVTKAKITPDFKYAKIYVSILNSKNIDKTMQGLKDSAGFIRSQIAKNINYFAIKLHILVF